MKKIYYIFTLLLSIFITACSPQQDELFDGSTSQRVDKTIKEVKGILAAAPQGWLFQYFAGDNQEYGGANMIVSFTAEGQTTVYNPTINSGAATTSLYSFKQYGGALLSFDTYNESLHYYADPVNPLGEGGGVGLGLEGDFEFVVMSYSADKVVLRGVKTLGISVLTALPADADVTATLQELADMQKNITAPSYEMYVNGEKYPSFAGTTKSFTIGVEVNGEVVRTIKASIIATKEGMRFYAPISLSPTEEEGTIQNFTFDAATDRLICSDEGQDIYFQKVYPPLNEVFAATQTQWLFDVDFSDASNPITDNMSASMAARFTASNASLSASYGGSTVLAYMGRNYSSDDPYWCVNFYSALAAGTYQGVFGYTPVPVAGTTDELQFTDMVPGLNAGAFSFYDTYVVSFIMSKTWKLIPNDPALPTSIRFEDTADATNWFVVSM